MHIIEQSRQIITYNYTLTARWNTCKNNAIGYKQTWTEAAIRRIVEIMTDTAIY